MVDVQEIKGQLLNVYNSMNFLKKIGVPVDSFNKNIKKTMELLKKGNLAEAKEEVLFIRKETGQILTRMDNIHNGLLQIEKEIAKMVKKGMNTVALRRLYSQCRLALKDKDYDQVQLFIIKMDKIIEMYNFLDGPALLVDVSDGEMIEEIITGMEVDAARRKKKVNGKITLSHQGRYTETYEDLPILVPLYDDDETEENEIPDNKQPGDREYPAELPQRNNKDDLKRDEREIGKAASGTVEIDWGKEEEIKVNKNNELRSRVVSIKTMLRENDIVDDDLVKGALVLEKLMDNKDQIGANELADELEKLLRDYIERREMGKVTKLYGEARRSLLELSEMEIDTKNIKILYERAIKLRDEQKLDIASRLFSEVISMCHESEISSHREKELGWIKQLKEKMDRIPSNLLDKASAEKEIECIFNKLNEGGEIGEETSELEKKIENAYNSYMKENLDALDRLFSAKIEKVEEKNIPVNSLHIIREKARAALLKENWDEAGELFKRGLDEIELTSIIANHKIELDRFEKDLEFLENNEAIFMETREYLTQCRNMIMRRDEENFCILFQKARELAGEDITRLKSYSYLSRLENCVGELSQEDMRENYTKRYLEAKSKSDEGRYTECLELTTFLINEITVKALEKISQ